MKYSIVPSYPAPDFTELDRVLFSLEGVSFGFQVDIVDGNFVSATSWPFSVEGGIENLTSLAQYRDSYELEIDCMILNPEQYLDVFVEVGFKRVVVHYGSTEIYEEIVTELHNQGIKVGIAFTSNTPVEEMKEMIPKFDYVQVMGISEVGKQGQSFDERTCDTVRAIRTEFPEIEIAIDGAVNKDTIPLLREAGANRFAPGSAITKAEDCVAAYKHLKSLITN